MLTPTPRRTPTASAWSPCLHSTHDIPRVIPSVDFGTNFRERTSSACIGFRWCLIPSILIFDILGQWHTKAEPIHQTEDEVCHCHCSLGVVFVPEHIGRWSSIALLQNIGHCRIDDLCQGRHLPRGSDCTDVDWLARIFLLVCT
jgi:hypothetical protein